MSEDRLDLARGLRTSLRNNASAYPYSVFITACLATVDTVVGVRDMTRIFLFVAGATLAFGLTEAAASRGFRDRFRPEPSDVVLLGSALAVFSVGSAVLVAWGAAVLLADPWGWFAAPFAGTVTYVLLSALEMALARRSERRDPPERTT